MALISAQTKSREVAPHVLSRQSFDIFSILEPTIAFALQFQQLLSNGSLSVFVRTCAIASDLLRVSRIVAAQSLCETKCVLANIVALSKNAGLAAWNTKAVRRWRKKMEHEFFTFALGCGNVLCLMLFWPGWWLLGIAIFAAWSLLVTASVTGARL
ncbi:uncharacterized protein BCR38DRAFT_488702 [Pseudomassariella vexata]|uniref:Uncharacterized protein n=1 Tax=Pseudomassariella vexata TaxID=1141098 RepID=A0A1Y2DKD0_9PEZI|nr:uncharacterized protein BCR38DRAFT_488702 [Pseudomassariella vexata]ORY59683.1 hypothetical protein BCR38DRAFT_488702 [Pseudomassariella vexata]